MKFAPKNAIYLLLITFPVILIDQITKIWAISLKGGLSVTVFESWFHLIYAENRGALFSLGSQFSEAMRKAVFLGFSTVVTLFVLGLLMVKSESKILTAVYALVIGGAVGNLIDRYRLGFVIDFIDWHVKDAYHWPTFNIADAAIVAAVTLVAIELLFFQKKKNPEN